MTAEQALEAISPEPNSGCWLWTGTLNPYGYGRFFLNGKHKLAHRMIYEMFIGPIPAGLQLDHKCLVKCCVNPEHLEPVTGTENMRRADRSGIGSAAKSRALTHCRKGHAFTEENTRREGQNLQRRRCRICFRERRNAWRAEVRATGCRPS